MKSQVSRRSSLFLLELVFAILFFVVAATVCVQFFVKSHTLEEKSVILDHSVNAASQVAELLQNKDRELLETTYPYAQSDENMFHIFYNESWKQCSEAEAVFTVNLETDYEAPYLYGDISVNKEGEELYELEVKYYWPEGGNS